MYIDQFSSVAQLCLTLCDSMNRSTPGLPVHRQFPEFTQTQVHQVSDAIQPSHPLSSPSPPAPKSLPASESFPMSQLFAWGGHRLMQLILGQWHIWICWLLFSSKLIIKHQLRLCMEGRYIYVLRKSRSV